ncbi:MAG TPA: hypothetical protein VJ654_02840 [Noviherbaspirillum sp.]|nr:hypothetical protein [Noviherbaspirillum sp.]
MEIALFWFFCAIFTAVIASSKGRSGFGWFILGLLFSFFALIAVAVMPSLKKGAFEPTPETHIRCPECREFVFMDATKCKHCGIKLVPVAPEPSKTEEFGRKVGSLFASKK